MTTAMPSTAIVVSEPVFTDAERVALAGLLAGYSGLTREVYALDLRQFASWCEEHHVHLFEARRADIECFGRDLEERGRARATVARRLCTVAGFYRYAVEEELLEHSPAVHVRRPRLDYESHVTGLDRNELGALLVAAGLGAAVEHALISLLALNGLRVSEATGADIEALGLERGHRTLTIVRKGGKVADVIAAADEEGRVVVSKDSDFRHSHLLRGQPSRLLAIVTGNVSNTDLLGLFNTNIGRILSALDESSFVELGATSLVVHGEPAGP